MQYEPIKRSLAGVFPERLFVRKLFFFLLDLLLLRSWHVRRALRNIARDYPGTASVLDAGAGFGQYAWRMSRMNEKWSIRAVDISAEHTEECRRFFTAAGLSGRVYCEQADLAAITWSDTFDMVLCVDVIEHIEDDIGVFRNFHRALKPGGRLLISTPSDQGGSDVHASTQSSFIDEHVRNGYSRQDISARLEEAGFRNISISYTYGVPGDISWRISMKYPVRMLNISSAFWIILPFYYMITFPFAFILNTFDLCLRHRKGTGLMITAQK